MGAFLFIKEILFPDWAIKTINKNIIFHMYVCAPVIFVSRAFILLIYKEVPSSEKQSGNAIA